MRTRRRLPTNAEASVAIAWMRTNLQPDERLYMVLVHRLRAGGRIVRLYAYTSGSLRPVTRAVAAALGRHYDEWHDGLAMDTHENITGVIEKLNHTLGPGYDMLAIAL